MRGRSDWSYAVLSKDAAGHGGPEAYLELVKAEGYVAGLNDGRVQGLAVSALVSAGIFVIKEGPRAAAWVRAKVRELKERVIVQNRGDSVGAAQTTLDDEDDADEAQLQQQR